MWHLCSNLKKLAFRAIKFFEMATSTNVRFYVSADFEGALSYPGNLGLTGSSQKKSIKKETCPES
jgi:hypothetical protein